MYDVFVQLCQANDVTPYVVGKATKIPASTFSDWKNGRSKPKQDKLQRIADFFGVSVEYLMTGTDPTTGDDSPYYTDPEVREIANAIHENESLRVLFDASKDISADDLRIVTDLVKRIKKENG